jgi:hypothetical protein
MTPHDDTAPLDEHSVELTSELDFGASRRRRTLAALSVALCLTGAGVILGLAGVRSERAHEAERAAEAAQREQLRSSEQGAVSAAAQEAQLAATASTPPAASAAPSSSSASMPAATALPPRRNQPAARRRSGAPDAPAVPSGSFHGADSERRLGTSESDLALPSDSTTTSGDIPGGNTSNGSVPGSVPNPALPNGSSNSTTLPGVPNDSSNSTTDLP